MTSSLTPAQCAQAAALVDYVRATVRRCRLPSCVAAEDVDGEAFLVMCKAVRDHEPAKGPLRAYVTMRVRHAVQDYLRGLAWGTRDGVALPVESLTDHRQEPEADRRRTATQGARDDLAEVIAHVPAACARTFRRWLEYDTCAEDAAADGVSIGAIWQRRNRAMQEARRRARAS